jgi:hypothetical protein
MTRCLSASLLLAASLPGCGSAPPAVEGKAVLRYDDGFTGTFRMAVVIDAEDGDDRPDFFGFLPDAPDDKRIVGTGDTRLCVPRLWKHDPGPTPATGQFKTAFPDLREGDFRLTFKEFRGGRYRLPNPPAGTAYLWFQTGFDGNRITQYPLAVRIPRTEGRTIEMDTVTGEWHTLFHTL